MTFGEVRARASALELEDTSPSADLVKDLYRTLPTVPWWPANLEDDVGAIVLEFFVPFKLEIEREGHEQTESYFRYCFFEDQAYWRDTLALTWHLRTFEGANRAGDALAAASTLRGVGDMAIVEGSVRSVRNRHEMSWIEFMFTFTTARPHGRCRGKVALILTPQEDNLAEWVPKIWTLATWLEDLADYPQQESLLRQPATSLDDGEDLTTDVLIVGAGNWGMTLAARLKTLHVSFILVDKMQHIGDNWALRYDYMKFHVPKSFAETPYIKYPDDSPDRLNRDDLAAQMRRFAKELQLEERVLLGTTIESTEYNAGDEEWRVTLSTGKTVRSKHLVIATGILSHAPYVPRLQTKSDLPDNMRNGDGSLKHEMSMHSTEFKSAARLTELGSETGREINSVTVVGSANTAFDITQDCLDAGLEVTMIQRSPTLIIPWDYYVPEGLGMFNHMPVEDADAAILGGPFAVGCQMLALVHAKLAAEEPHRYDAVKEIGFQVVDCTEGDLMANLLGRHGGHYVDIGGIDAIVNSPNFTIKSGFTPTAVSQDLELTLTPNEHNRDAEAETEQIKSDAIIWCTGFRDLDMRNVVVEVLGDGGEAVRDKMETTWGLSMEGEHRGMFVRQKGLVNFWAVGGGCAHQRWYSRVVAWQIKAELEGVLPEPFLD